ncbi:MAG: carbohydrate ABC transporter permease [bacterium]
MIKAWRHMSRLDRRVAIIAYTFLLPAIIYFTIFFLVPILINFYMSFYSGFGVAKGAKFIGLKNYIKLLHDITFLRSIRTTLIFTGGTVCLNTLIALLLALILNEKLKLRIPIRSIIFFPYLTALVVVALVWKMMFHSEMGIINYILSLLRIPSVGWLTKPNVALFSLMLMSAWHSSGYNMVIFLAGLQNIPEEYYDASKVDGASKIAQMRYITLPLLSPTFLFVVTMSIIGSFQSFTQVFIMTQGGPAESTNLIVYYLYQMAFNNLRVNYASAMSFVLFLIIFILSFIQIKVWRGGYSGF